MVITTIRFVVADNKKKDVIKTMRHLIEPIKGKFGCIDCWGQQDLMNENCYTLIESWESHADLERHVRSNEYKIILSLMDLSSTPPEIHYDSIATRQGFEALRKIREKQVGIQNI